MPAILNFMNSAIRADFSGPTPAKMCTRSSSPSSRTYDIQSANRSTLKIICVSANSCPASAFLIIRSGRHPYGGANGFAAPPMK